VDYLSWLAEDEPARKAQRFVEMSTGWVIGGEGFAEAAVRAQAATLGQGRRTAEETRAPQEAVWQETLAVLLEKSGRTEGELASDGKSAEEKLAFGGGVEGADHGDEPLAGRGASPGQPARSEPQGGGVDAEGRCRPEQATVSVPLSAVGKVFARERQTPEGCLGNKSGRRGRENEARSRRPRRKQGQRPGPSRPTPTLPVCPLNLGVRQSDGCPEQPIIKITIGRP